MQADSSAGIALGGFASAPVEVIPGLVWAFRIHADGKPEALPVDSHIEIKRDGLLWLHLNLADGRATQWLSQAELHIPDQARAVLLSKDSYQQVHAAEHSIFGVISDLLRDIDDTNDDTGYLRFAMTEHVLISGRHHALCAVDATRRLLEQGQRVNSVAALLETIVENVADTMDGVANELANSLDEVEELVVSGTSNGMLQKLGKLRRVCVRLHRQLSGLRIVFHRLEQRGVSEMKPALQLRAGKLAQRLDDLDHAVVEMRERSRLLQEELHLQIEERGNESIRVLSVLTAMLLPPTLVTGIFGMNTKGLPLTEVESGFLWACVLIMVSSASAYFIMKRLGVIR